MTTTTGTRRTAELRSPSGRLEATFIPGVGMLGWSLRRPRRGASWRVPCRWRTTCATGEPTAIALLHPWANRLAIAGVRGRRPAGRARPGRPERPHGSRTACPSTGWWPGSPHWELLEAAAGAACAAGSTTPRTAGADGRLPVPARARARGRADGRAARDRHRAGADGRRAGPGRVRVSSVPAAAGPRARALVGRAARDQPHGARRAHAADRPQRAGADPAGTARRSRASTTRSTVSATAPEFVLAGRRPAACALRFLEGYRFAQVFAPRGRDFISFEPMTAPISPFADERTPLTRAGLGRRRRRYRRRGRRRSSVRLRGQSSARAGAPSQPGDLERQAGEEVLARDRPPRRSRPSITPTPRSSSATWASGSPTDR